MMLSLATLGPLYSVVYTAVAINPDSHLAKMTALDPDIPKGVEGARWIEVPGIWWGVVERLSWTMLARPKLIHLGYFPSLSVTNNYYKYSIYNSNGAKK